MRKYAVIVAGGKGLRAGGGLPKQFHDLCGRPLLWWSMKAFVKEDPTVRIILVLHPDYLDVWNTLYGSLPECDRFPVEVRFGASERAGSVKNGIEGIPAEPDVLVAVHDAARPLVTPDLVARGWKCASEAGACVPVVAVTDSMRVLSKDGANRSVVRSDYVAVQTPQVFRGDIMAEAYRQELRPEFTDDASVAEAAGFDITLFEGDSDNIKVTAPKDFAIASLLMSGRR